MFKVSLIVPTYNEAKNFPLLVEEIFNFVDQRLVDLEIIVVDDNSPDGTGQVAEAISKKFPLKVIHRPGKSGLGSAVRDGFLASRRPWLGVMDADLSHDPQILNNLILSLQDHDLAIGSRFQPGSRVERWSGYRKLLSYAGVWLARRLTKVKDPLSGYFFLRRQVIDGVKLKTSGYKILLEILVAGNYQKVKEIPFNFRMRQFSSSKLNATEYWLFLVQLIKYAGYRLLSRGNHKP